MFERNCDTSEENIQIAETDNGDQGFFFKKGKVYCICFSFLRISR